MVYKLLIPNAAPATAARKRAFVSASTNGVLVTTYAHSDTNHTNPLAEVATNVASPSPACTGGTSGRTCNVQVTAPAGDDDFVFGLYDESPVGGAIPATAHELGLATVTQNIVANSLNTVTAPIEGIIAGLGATQTIGFGADGYAHAVALVIAPTDFGNNQITAGLANAPFANAITATVAETGGSGHTTISLNGGSPSAQVTIAKATDAVQANYDGNGAAGYRATITFSAPAVAGQGGATQQNLVLGFSQISVSNPTVFYSPHPAALNTYPQGQHLLAISDPGVAAGTTFSATPSGCTGIVSAGTAVGTGTAATLLVVGGAQLSSSGCSLAIGDGTNSYTVDVTNELRPAPAASPTMTEYSVGANKPTGITTGADGNLWFSECGAPAISSIKPNGTGYTTHSTAAKGIPGPYQAALGPDGNVWFGDSGASMVGSVTTAGVVSGHATTYENPYFVSAGLDGSVWFDECMGPVVGSIDTANQSLAEITGAPNGIYGVAIGPNGNIVFASNQDGAIGSVQNGVAANFTTSSLSSDPFDVAAGSDGNIWFTTGSTIGKMSPSGLLLDEYSYSGASLPSPSSAIFQILTPGPDGALWFTDAGNSVIGRVTTGGTITTYATTTAASSPTGITVGPDGNIWFTECATGKIGVITP